jgi:transcription-repair coupling factor (superfamily II helicase)
MGLNFIRDVPEFRDLVRLLEVPPPSGPASISVSGVADPAKPFFLAALTAALSRTVVFVQSAELSLPRLEERCAFFLGQLRSPKRGRALPSPADTVYAPGAPSLEATSARMRFFHDLLAHPPALVLTDLFGLLAPFPAPDRLAQLFVRLEKNMGFERDRLLQTLADFGYAREDLIAFRGEYAARGAVVDVYPPWQGAPCRVEYSGDEVVSLREFDPATQRSTRRLETVLIPSLLEPAGAGAPAVSFDHYLRDAVFIVDRPEDVENGWDEALAELSGAGRSPDAATLQAWAALRDQAVRLDELGLERGERTFHIPFQSVPKFENRIPFFLEYLKRLEGEGDQGTVFLTNPAIRRKVGTLLEQSEIPFRDAESALDSPKSGEILLVLGDLDRGFACAREKVVFFAEADILTEERVVVSRPSARPSLTQFQDLKAGDPVVHADYGIGIFQGLVRMDMDGPAREFIELRYRDDDKLFVPVEDLSLVQKYTQIGGAGPVLDKLGTNSWQKTKTRTKKAIETLARELLDLYARRKAVQGFRFSPAGSWEEEFEKTFEYEETEDQRRSIRDIRADMETSAPMDRLLCGDVGYGKTEVAMRAAFKAVMDGKQVAVLCPTTVLASQHLKTFASRLLLFPVRVEGLSRLQSKSQQDKVVADLGAGRIDIVIGTHRLLSKDVVFRDLGLLVVDEEQRFGVTHKEKIKQMKANIDVLTLTATPIPRTLNLSLTGLRDISLIETPPKDRLAVHTVVTTFSPKLIAAAVRQELARGGQVYYIFNKIDETEHMASLIAQWVPQAQVVTVHGQMAPAELEKRMIDFIDKTYNVLVSTTIIENGIDIPLVNTLIVHRADHFGLAQLYQLRGRVGRSPRQAFAYFLVPPFNELTPLAKRRLEALKEFSELGSGFRLAMKDLEIRGAGHLFGASQHGTMEAVGFDYFLRLLEQSILELKGEEVEEVKSEINLKVGIQIPETYVPQVNVRLSLYKRISSAAGLDEVDLVQEEIVDRFGPAPRSVVNLCQVGRIKYLAQKLKVRAVDRVGDRLAFKFLPSTSVQLGRLTSVLNRYAGSMTPDGVMSLALRGRNDEEILRETLAVLKEFKE